MFSLPTTYDWKEDPEHLKSKAAQTLALTKMREVVRTVISDTYSYLMEFINAEANFAIINGTAIPQIVHQINQQKPLSDNTPVSNSNLFRQLSIDNRRFSKEGYKLGNSRSSSDPS
jgi:hypothetical protein